MREATKYRLTLVRDEAYTYEAKVTGPDVLARNIQTIFSLEDNPEEVFVLLAFDTKNNIIGAFEVSHGTVNQTLVHPRDIFKRLLLVNALAFALGHNHPSGSTTPSREDLQLTERLRDASELMGIKLLDHIVLGDEGRYYSLKEHGDF